MDLEHEALARRMGVVAQRVRDVQQQLGGADPADWTGLGAARFRERLARATREVAAVAGACDEAAARLAAHARAVDAVGTAVRAGITAAVTA